MAGKMSCDTASLISNLEDAQDDLIHKPSDNSNARHEFNGSVPNCPIQRSTTTAVLSSHQQNLREQDNSRRQRSNSLGKEDIDQFMDSITNTSGNPVHSASVTITCKSVPIRSTGYNAVSAMSNTIEAANHFEVSVQQQTDEDRSNFPVAHSSLSHALPGQLDDDIDATTNTGISSAETVWEMNYHEAAIFLQEGEDNDKFDSHPGERSALPAYLLTHSPWFYALDLIASSLLLALAMAEKPATKPFQDMNEGIHATVELFALCVLGLGIVMQLKWLGWRNFGKHTRSMLKSCAWLVMVAEAITVIVRNTSHFRATRALRPIFLLDNRYLFGVRRFMRQLLQSVPPVLEIIAILMLVLAVFTMLGYYLFSPHPEDPYFTTLPQSFVSLFVLLTTANYPDVMMPSYARSRWSAAFFILYLAITLYCIMNFLLAIVFVVFSAMEKDKFRKLLLHKRRACQLAFRLLVTRSEPHAITYAHFTGMLKYYRPKAKVREVYLTFKALDKCGRGALALSEFYQVYTACGLRWTPRRPEPPWFSQLPGPGPLLGRLVRAMVLHPAWDAIVYLVICSNGIVLLVLTFIMSAEGAGASHHPHVSIYQIVFIAFYSCEVLLKLIGLGTSEYFRSGWNVFDLSVTVMSILGVLAETLDHAFYYVVILRPLRLLRLFRVRRRYREVFETLSLLAPRVLSACVVISVIYYFFAIIGMEMFSKYDLRNCCVNSTVEQYYHSDNSSRYQNYYYLNNFDNIFMAGVTLFELTVVNNWFIIMEGYAYVSNEWSRLFFMLFYLAMMVVMSVVLAFIIEAFTFRMQYNQTVNKDRLKPKSEVTRVVVSLTTEEMEFVYRDAKDKCSVRQYNHDINTAQGGVVQYLGLGPRSKTALQLRMYKHLLHNWIRDAHHHRDTHLERSSGMQESTEVADDGSAVETRVTQHGNTELLTQTAWEGVRERGASIASNLMEWWKADYDEGDDGPDCRVEGVSNAVWGIDEDEVANPPSRSTPAAVNISPCSSSNVMIDSMADNSAPNFVSMAFSPLPVAAVNRETGRYLGHR